MGVGARMPSFLKYPLPFARKKSVLLLVWYLVVTVSPFCRAVTSISPLLSMAMLVLCDTRRALFFGVCV